MLRSSRGWKSSSRQEAAINTGTIASKAASEVSRRSAVPATAPSSIGASSRTRRWRCSSSRSAYATAPPTAPGIIPIVLVTFAEIGGSPRATMVGKVISEPAPAMAFEAPAATPAAATASSSSIASSLAENLLAEAPPERGPARLRPAPLFLVRQLPRPAGPQHALGVRVAALRFVVLGPDQDVLAERRQVAPAEGAAVGDR